MRDKNPTHDELGYPLLNRPNFSKFYSTLEQFVPMSPNVRYFYDIDIDRYFVSTFGRVYNKYLNTIIPQQIIPSRNRHIVCAFKTPDNREIFASMHRIVILTFIGFLGIYPTNELVVIDHKDGIMWHNEPYNLEWTTNSENISRAIKNQWVDKAHGERNGWAALTDDIYHEICRLTELGYMPNEINKMINCGKDITNIAQKVRKGEAAIHIASQYDFSNIPRNNYSKFSDSQVHEICKAFSLGYDEQYIINSILRIDICNMDPESRYDIKKRIRNIKNRISFKNISKNYSF